MVRQDPSAALTEHYRPLATLIARLVAREICALRAEPRFYTQYDAPLKKRAFLAAARQGAFPSHRRGRTVFALRADVHAYIEQATGAGGIAAAGENGEASDDEIGSLLDGAGLVSERHARTRGGR